MGPNKSRLVGIKAIAKYLSISERNVYRWESELGLPLRRVAESKGRSVYVELDELEGWIKNQKSLRIEKKGHFYKNLARISLLSLGIISLAIAIIFIVKQINGQRVTLAAESEGISNPISATFEGNAISIKSQNGTVINTYVSCDGKPDFNWELYKCVCFSNVDGDKKNEFLGRKYDPEKKEYYLVLFDNNGNELWKQGITNEQKFDGMSFHSDYFPLIVKFARANDKEIFIVTYWRHRTRFISLISRHNIKGKLINKYVHTGHLLNLDVYDLDDDGADEIIFSGTNNLLNGEGVFGVLRLSDFKGVSPPYQVEPEYRSSAFYLQSYVPDEPLIGNQINYIRFKRTYYLNNYPEEYIVAKLDGIDSNLIHFLMRPWKFDLDNPVKHIGFEYAFDFKFDLLDVIPDPPLRELYPLLLKRKEIDIPLEDLLEVYKKEVVFRWEADKWLPINTRFLSKH